MQVEQVSLEENKVEQAAPSAIDLSEGELTDLLETPKLKRTKAIKKTLRVKGSGGKVSKKSSAANSSSGSTPEQESSEEFSNTGANKGSPIGTTGDLSGSELACSEKLGDHSMQDDSGKVVAAVVAAQTLAAVEASTLSKLARIQQMIKNTLKRQLARVRVAKKKLQ